MHVFFNILVSARYIHSKYSFVFAAGMFGDVITGGEMMADDVTDGLWEA